MKKNIKLLAQTMRKSYINYNLILGYAGALLGDLRDKWAIALSFY